MDDWDDDDFDEPESDEYDDGPAETVRCPECGAGIYEDVDQCPVCGFWIVHSKSPLDGRPKWFVVLGLIGIVAVIATLSGVWRFL